MNSMIIQLIVHSCVFLMFTHFSVYMLYNAPLKLYNAPLYSKMAAFKSSNFSLAYTGRRARTRFPPDTFGIYIGAPWYRQKDRQTKTLPGQYSQTDKDMI